MSKRSRSADELDRALALSLAESVDQEASAWAEARERVQKADREALDHAIASSLQEVAEPPSTNTWDCAICTLTNDESSGRCEVCGSDRATPYAARQRPPERTEWRCGLPGCNRPRVHFDFCCEDHKSRAAARGLLPTQTPGEDRVFVGASGDYSCALLTNQSPQRGDVVRQFREAWRKPGAVPRVERVYAVRPSPMLRERHERYAAAVGNPRRRFHGTGAACNFAIDDNLTPCASPQCALCSILAGSFALAHSGRGPNASRATFGTAGGLRYGRGLYFSSTSGKSNDYAHRSERMRRGRRWRTLFLASVAAGKAYCTEAAELDLSRPPDGYDSVVGEVGPNLNYDELVVYNEAAALPEFLIVVSFDP
jgi:hypothetical protein